MRRLLAATGFLATSAFVLLATTIIAAAAPPDELVAAARKEGRLAVIALPRDWCNYGRIIDGFKARYGLAVDELQPEASSETELDTVRASRGNDDPMVPDVIDVGLSFAEAAKSEGLLQPYKVSTWDSIPEAAKDTDGYWYGDYYGLLVFEVNADRVARLPVDWPDLASPEFRNAIGIAGAPGSNQTIQTVLAAGLSATNGRIDEAARRGLEFFAELNRRGNLAPMIGNAETLADGRTPVLIRWDHLALGDRDALAGKTRITVVRPRTGIVAGVYAQAISAYARRPNAARLWMEHLYSDEVQLIMLDGRCHPIRLGALLRERKVPANLLQDLPSSENDRKSGRAEPVFPTIEEQQRARDIILKGWDGIVGVTIECQPPGEPDPGPISRQRAPTQPTVAFQQCARPSPAVQ